MSMDLASLAFVRLLVKASFSLLLFSPKENEGGTARRAPPGKGFACHSSGWMQLDIFTDWLKHFLNITRIPKIWISFRISTTKPQDRVMFGPTLQS